MVLGRLEIFLSTPVLSIVLASVGWARASMIEDVEEDLAKLSAQQSQNVNNLLLHRGNRLLSV